LRDATHADRAAMLLTIANDESQDTQLRAEAVMGLSADDKSQRKLLWKMAHDERKENEILRKEALRGLRAAALDDQERLRIADLIDEGGEIATLASRVANPQSPLEKRPDKADIDAWMKLLEGPADAAAGERVFFHAKSVGCYRCHRHDGRGAEVGPDLTMLNRSADRRRIVESILQPAKDIAPLFFAWQIETEDGGQFVGMLADEQVNGDQTYVDVNGKRTTFKLGEIAMRKAVTTSIMPDSVVDGLTTQELRDLMAFLLAPLHNSK
jgi:putative heme-binding domain-containing protein